MRVSCIAAALILLSPVGILANCAESNGYPVVQCGARAWFAPPPAGSGALQAVWWQIGFGNNTFTTDPNDIARSATDGTGFQAGRGFIGNDSGLRSGLYGLDLVDASDVGGPAGSLCFSSGSSWGPPGIDGCVDNERVYDVLLQRTFDDNILNPYWSYYTSGGYTRAYLVDSPMGVLLTESSGTSFALAFFASQNRHLDPNDLDSGVGFDMGAIVNGDPNPVVPGANNIVPWQPVPQPLLFPRVLPDHLSFEVFMSWSPVRFVDDGSTRPSPTVHMLGGATGVGVRDQGPLVRHVVETAPVFPGSCGEFSPAAETTGSTATVVVPGITCLRLVTHFGRKPQSTTTTSSTAAVGRLGDIGFSVVSRTRFLSILASDRAELILAERGKGSTRAVWQTEAEITLAGFEVIGRDSRGAERLLATHPCSECTTGLGARYEVALSASELKGAKSIVIVSQPSGARSNELEIR